MKQNVGKSDKVFRMILGIIIIIVGIYLKSWWALVGGVLVVTALTGFCPLYRLFGWNTCKTNINVP